MSAIPSQRPAAPWSEHGGWGQFDDPASLPNVAGSDFQVEKDLQGGDTAWSESDSALYVCTDPTPGAAIWVSLMGGGGGGGALQDAYDAGNTIVASVARPVALSNAVDITDLLTLTRSFAGAGDGLEVVMAAGTTGRGVRVVAGGSGTGVLVTDGGTEQIGITTNQIFKSGSSDLSIAPSTTDLRLSGGAGGASAYLDTGAGGGGLFLGFVNAIDVSLGNAASRIKIGDVGSLIGFYGNGAVSRPTVTGSRNGNPALADLLSDLDTQGLVTDSTVAGTVPAGTSILQFGQENVSSTTTTRYLAPGFDDGIASVTPISIAITRAGTLKNLSVRHNLANGNGTVITYDVRVNGVVTALSVKVPSGAVGTVSDLANVIPVVAGDSVDIVVTKPNSSVSGLFDAAATMELA